MIENSKKIKIAKSFLFHRDVDMDDWTLLINRYQQTSSNLDLEEEDEMKQGLPKELDSLYHESLKDEDLGGTKF